MTFSDILATIALAISLGSIGIQIWQWRKSGHNIVLSARQGFFMPDGGVSSMLTIVRANNRGRGSVDVTGWGFRAPNGESLVLPFAMPGSDPLPTRVVGGARADWMMPTDEINAYCAKSGVPYPALRPFVNLGNGDTIYGKPGIGLKPS